MHLRIGTRGSPLALWQADWVAGALRRAHAGLEIEVVTIRTLADKFPQEEAAAIGVGIFTRELDEALRRGDIDLAVHSLKDVPSELDPELEIAAVPERETPLDAFLADGGTRLDELPPGARLGTGSPRRKAQLLHRRPDLSIVPLRGNVGTRLRKLRELGLAGTVLAHAGLRRLGAESRITEVIAPEVLLPAVSQGALGVMAQAGSQSGRLAAALDHPQSRLRVRAERSFLRGLRGGCQVPAGALATLPEDRLLLQGVIAAPDGSACIRGEARDGGEGPEELGARLARELLEQGGASILERLRKG